MITVKILCECGTKFSFEAEEGLTLAAGAIACPNCGADATRQAEAQLSAARLPPEPTASAGDTAPSPLRVSLRKAAETNEPESAGADTRSAPDQGSGAAYRRRPLTKSEEQILRNRESRRRRKPFVIAAVLLITMLVGFWGWYRFVGSRPKVTMNVQYERVDRPVVPRLLAGDQLFLIRNRELSLTDLRTDETLWRKPFGNVTNFDDSLPIFSEVNTRVARPTPEVRVTDHSFWAIWPDHVLSVDRAAGAPLVSIKVHEDSPMIRVGDQLLLLEKSPRTTNRLAVDAFSFDDGKPRPFEVAVPPRDSELDLVPDGQSVVAVLSRLVERHIITNKLATGPRVMTAAGVEKSVDQNFDKVLNENLTAGNSLSATVKLVEQLNRRDAADQPDETYEDRSLYEVELRRVQGAASTWQGRIIGRPLYFPLPTVDIVTGGQEFKVLEKNGRLRWEGTLSFPLTERAAASARFHHPLFERFDRVQFDPQNGLRYRFPFVERDNRLYVYDAGVLAAFDLQSGEVRWRVTSVGIRWLNFDAQGMLYAGTTRAGADTLTQPAASKKRPEPVDALLKLDPATGQILWTVPYIGTELHITGKLLYSQWVAETSLDRAAALSANAEVVPTCIIARIDPGTGDTLWQRSYKGEPDIVAAVGTRVLIQFPRRTEMLHFFSF